MLDSERNRGSLFESADRKLVSDRMCVGSDTLQRILPPRLSHGVVVVE